MNEPRYEFLLRNTLLGAVVSLLLLRYFWQRHEWESQMRAESEARYLALQARIRPHFLFNSLNSIAELIRTRPGQAEDMVVDLADLFRVSLDSRSRLVTLRDELEVVRGYLRIEEVRLADKLQINWAVPEELMSAQLPRLVVQPLAENAVFHGVSRLTGPGVIHISAHRDGDFLVVDVENPMPPQGSPETRGTGVAVNNIAQRIKLIYGDRARIQLGEDRNEFGPLFRARLRLPLDFGHGEGI
jgi:two-component system sensor histidine kinase AlgZ